MRLAISEIQHCESSADCLSEVASVVYNYSQADIPLETMWTDSEFTGPYVFRHLLTFN